MPTKRPENLQSRHNVFAAEFAATRNGAQSAIKAGYAAGTAAVKASQLLAKPVVQALVAQIDKDTIERTNVTKDWIITETCRTYNRAFELDNVAAARSCLHLLAMLHGHIVDRKDLRIINGVKDLTDDELARIAATVIEGDPVVAN